MRRKAKLKSLALSVLAAEATGVAGALLSGAGINSYNFLYRPNNAPSWWLLAVVWLFLYFLIGTSAWLVFSGEGRSVSTRFVVRRAGGGPANIKLALVLYSAQLFANFIWLILFFGFYLYFCALLWLLLLLSLVLLTYRAFLKIAPLAAWLLVPYILWLIYMVILNIQFWFLNALF